MKDIQNIPVAVLGATGVVGQVFFHMLANHPFFNLSMLTGSDSRIGKSYADEVQWLLPNPMPERCSQLKLDPVDISLLKNKKINIVFSALPTDIARSIEPKLRENGFYVFSNASAMRYDPDVPILIPEVNPESLALIEKQGFPSNGFVITNANCSTTGLAAALAPLRQFGIKEVFVSTYQSVSGAGYPGIPALDIMGNSIPFIDKEEEKMKIELQKILDVNADVYASCVRIPVLFGHLETTWVTFDKNVETNDIIDAWNDFTFTPHSPGLPTIPEHPVAYINNRQFPQHRMNSWGSPAGMQVFTGRLRKQGDKIGFALLVNNLVKGAAGGSIANAELFVNKYLYENDSQR
jgi:aspartate-semialdehyde dehydrogenase